VVHVRQKFGASERRACRVLGQPRSTQRRVRRRRGDELALRGDIGRLAGRYGRYGYRRVTALLRAEGWPVNHKRVERIWRQEGLKVPSRQPKRARLWLNDGSCVRLRPTHPGSVWSYDFTAERTHDGRPLKMLTVLGEYTRECLAIVVERRLRSDDVLHCLTGLFTRYGPPDHLRSDNGPEFTATVVRKWLERVGVRTLYIEPGSPWENGYNESFNGKPEGRAPEPGDPLYAEGGAGPRGAVAEGVQHDSASQCARPHRHPRRSGHVRSGLGCPGYRVRRLPRFGP
jgi:transposase InsO family protein